jgi:[ribosomal protein S5]-alanine N-acetyltransferase
MTTVTIAPPTVADCSEFLAAVERSRALHGDWVAPPATEAEFGAYLASLAGSDRRGFLVRKIDDQAAVGVVNLNNIVRGQFLSAYLGFYAFEPWARHGYMSASLRLVVGLAFSEIGLHRLEANIQPTNSASIALVRSCGFRREGFSPRYLRIAGDWRDHERWALLADEGRSPALAK